ncbi:hypothetical protein HK104_000405 [Borealophlyctis nickersoniae]|nr:hypothetical protein HK104_000405 [Borealophlyctis nickersoniae]
MLSSAATWFLATTLAVAGLTGVSAQGWSSGLCTFHNYEGDKARLGAAYDNSPGWCGIRYSALNAARITAVHGLDTGAKCGLCLEIASASGGPSAYVLAVDQKGAPGLDVAKSSFQAIFPKANPYDPQTCKWRTVASSLCQGVCFGSKQECTPGVRNLLPAYLLPPINPANANSHPKTVKPPTRTTTTVRRPTPTRKVVVVKIYVTRTPKRVA